MPDSDASPVRDNGRPSKWNPSGQRKLARLYAYTTLSIEQILKVLTAANVFGSDTPPSKDSINKKLSQDFDKEPRWIRPKSPSDMNRRMAELDNSPTRSPVPENNPLRPSHLSRARTRRTHSRSVSSNMSHPSIEQVIQDDLTANESRAREFRAPENALSPAPWDQTHPAHALPSTAGRDNQPDLSSPGPRQIPLAVPDPSNPDFRHPTFTAADKLLHRSSTVMATSTQMTSTQMTSTTIQHALLDYPQDLVNKVSKLVKQFTLPMTPIEAERDDDSPSASSAATAAANLFDNDKADDSEARADRTPIVFNRPLPGDFLRLDLELKERPPCPGPRSQEHDTRSCYCRAAAECTTTTHWVSREGVSPWVADFFSAQPTRSTSRLLSRQPPPRDPFGNTPLHLLAARDASHDVLLRAVAVSPDPLVPNSAGQTFLHLLRASWFVSDGPVSELLRDLERGSHDIYSRDVFGRGVFHVLHSQAEDVRTVESILHGFDFEKYCRRDAFGLIPGYRGPGVGEKDKENEKAKEAKADRGEEEEEEQEGEGEGEGEQARNTNSQHHHQPQSRTRVPTSPLRVDTAAAAAAAAMILDQKDPSVIATKKHARLLELVSKAQLNPTVEDAKGRNGLHSLADVILSEDTLMAKYGQPASSKKPSAKSSARHHHHITYTNPSSPTLKRKFQTPHTKRDLSDASEGRLSLRLELLNGLLAANVDANHRRYSAVFPAASSDPLAGATPLMAFVANLPEDGNHRLPPQILHNLVNAINANGSPNGNGGTIDMDARNRRGETALHVAVRRGRKLAARTLVQCGANVHARDGAGRGVLEIIDDQVARLGADAAVDLGTTITAGGSSSSRSNSPAGVARRGAGDEKANAHFEACRAWLSGKEGGAVQRPSLGMEWAWERER